MPVQAVVVAARLTAAVLAVLAVHMALVVVVVRVVPRMLAATVAQVLSSSNTTWGIRSLQST
jgi:hypothetical protein